MKKACCHTCMNGFFQLGVVFHGLQRLIITRVALQSFLCTTGCHPNSGAVLVRHTFTHKPFHFQNKILQLHLITTECQMASKQCLNVFYLCLSSSSPHGVSLEGAWTISSTFYWGQLHTHSSSPCRVQNREVSQSHRGQSCCGKTTQSSTTYKWTTVHKAQLWKRTDIWVTFLPTLLSLSYSLMTDTTTATTG